MTRYEVQSFLARSCPVCDALYAEHDLEDLVWCMESVLGDDWRRPVENVDTKGRT